MSYSGNLGSALTNTRLRAPHAITHTSGMCAVCTTDCPGTCEIGYSAVRGPEATYPFSTDIYQFASEKKYPIDFSHFNINGSVFGAIGIEANSDLASYPNANTDMAFGRHHKVPLKAPYILPAMAKLNWHDYFAGAAMYGVLAVIGEDVVAKDPELKLHEGKVISSPLVEKMVKAFRDHDRGFGDIILQANEDDERLGVLDYAIQTLGVKSVELKFGQAAKGIQGLGRITKLEEAQRIKRLGYLVFPDPTDEDVIKNYHLVQCETFEKVGRLPMWDEYTLEKRIKILRSIGAERICFKVGPYAPSDLLRIMKIACDNEIDLITFDGASGGTGNSPVKMMNEWGVPTVVLLSTVRKLAEILEQKGMQLPEIAITGGLSTEDHVYKALAMGAPYVRMVGLGRAAMAAANSGKWLGDAIERNEVPMMYSKYGDSVDTIFEQYPVIKRLYGERAAVISTGAIGVYSYLERLSTGLKQFMALNRKFTLKEIDREDLYALTDEAEEACGVHTYQTMMEIMSK